MAYPRFATTFFVSATIWGCAYCTEPLPFEVKLETLLRQEDPKWQWFHPRPAAVPGFGKAGAPLTLITLQKHLFVSDYYSGLAMLLSKDLGKTWTAPTEIRELGWRAESDKVDIAVADVTPGWHSRSGKLLAVGAQVRYDKKGKQLDDKPQSHQTAYAIFDPESERWSTWKTIQMPAGPKFNFARSACAQWLELPDGTVLLPFYYGADATSPHSVTVAEFSFNGQALKYQRHGSELELNQVRGLVEPSIVKFRKRFFLTIRNDLRAYVSSSSDGLQYQPIKEWRFDDGGELGSYNTQAHWLAHSDALFLIYTQGSK